MRTARAAAFVTLIFASACSGGGGAANTFVPSSERNASAAAPASVKTTLPARLKPPAPARLFAETASVLGQLLRFCKDSTCADIAARTPVFVAEQGPFVMFTVDSPPLEAFAEVRVRPSEKPDTVKLDPGTLMVFDHGLGAGRFLIDLVCRWRSSEARWRFGLNVT